MAIKKIWGTTIALVKTPLFEMHRLDIMPWSRCSKHVHRNKHNVFVVLEGALYIDEWKPNGSGGFDSQSCKSTLIGPEDWRTVPPGLWHQFRTGPDHCIALEMYHPEALSEDITRADVGERLGEVARWIWSG